MNIPFSSRISSTAPYPFAEIEKKATELKEKGIEVIDFGVGDPKEPTPDFVINALKEGAGKYAAAGYPSYTGSAEFRQAATEYMKQDFNVELDPDTEITSSIGSKEAVFHFPLAFVDPGDIVICPTPGYPPYKTGTRFAGGEPFFVPLLPENDFLIDLEAIPQDIAKKAKIIWTNYPNSPTGRTAPKDWLQKLIDWAHKYNVIIAADEGCYIDIYFEQKPMSILELDREGIITFYSLSKRNNMTGYRIGFCAGDKQVISAFKKVKTNIDSGTPNFVQHAAIAGLKDQKHARQMRDNYWRKRDILLEALTKTGLPRCESDATFYIWQKAKDGMTGVDLAQALLKKGIVVTPGAFISDETVDGINPGTDYVRFALVPEEEEIKEAARRILNIKI